MTMRSALARHGAFGAALLVAAAWLPAAAPARPNPGGLGGPASGAGLRPGAGRGAPGAGLAPRPGAGFGGLGGPASGAGLRPGAGWGAPGPGLTRAPAAAYGAAAYHPGWAAGGYWAARPWGYGWYGASPMAWWGVGLATSATVAAAVNAAADQQATVIVVPQTAYQLNYASVRAVAPASVTFTYGLNGVTVAASGDCRNGLLNGQVVAGADAAQLLNAACVIAYGTGG